MEALNRGTNAFFDKPRLDLAKDTPQLHHAISALAVLGSPIMLCLILLLAAGMLVQRRRYAGAAILLTTAALVFLVVLAMNELIGHGDKGTPGARFLSPSGFLASAAFFLLAVVLGSRMRLWRTSLAVSGVCLVMVLALGFCELYFQREWLTPLLGGWIFGVLMALLACQLAGLAVPGLVHCPGSIANRQAPPAR